MWLETRDNKLELYKEDGEIKYWNYPYSFEDLKDIKTSQNFDVIYFCHNNYSPKKLTRTYTDNSINFSFSDVVFETGTGRQNPVSIDGNPSCCCFYQQRLFYSGFKNNFNKIWASDIGYYDRFTTNRELQSQILDIDGFNFVLSEIKLPINWIKDTTVGLILGSFQGIAVIKTESAQLTPFSFSCSIINKDGASKDNPITVGTTLLYIDTTLKRIRALTYNWEVNSYISTNLNIYCPELIQENIKKICFQEDEKDLVYVLTEKGNLYYLLYSSSEMLFSWGKISSYTNFKWIETLEKYTNGTNLFLIDKQNNILRKTEEIILEQFENVFSKVKNNQEAHNYYYNYLLNKINDFNYLDYSKEIYYHNNSTISFNFIEKTDEGNFYIITSDNENEFEDFTEEELKTFLLQTREEQKQFYFEIREKINNFTIKTLLLNETFEVGYTTNNWSYNKNILDGIDNNIYEDGTKYSIVGDGYYYNNIEIKNGKIKLPEGIAIGRFKIGYNYIAKLKTMNLGGMLDTMNTMIAKKNISKVYLRLYNSWGGKYGTDYFDLKNINYLKLQFLRFSEPYTMEEDVKIDVNDKWEFNKSYWIIQELPYPININSITILQEQN